MPAGFLYQNMASVAQIASFQATVTAMPIENLRDPQPRRRVRLIGFAGGSVITLDFSSKVPIDCAAMISTTIGVNDSVQIELSDHPLFLSVLANTGILNASASDEGMGNVIITLPAPISARYMRISIWHAANSIDIGLLIAGALWRTTRSIAYGIEEGREILDRRDRNPFTGAEFPVPAIINPRFARFTLPVISDAEVRDYHRDLVRMLGAAKDGLVIPDLTDGLAERNRRAIYGALNLPGGGAGTIMRAYSISERSFSVTERV